MGSIDALALAIKEFEGGVVIVSHDFRTFLLTGGAKGGPVVDCLGYRPYIPSRPGSLGGEKQDDQKFNKARYFHH